MTDTYIGILSGTSMDAIDVATVSFSHNKATLQHALNVALPSDYKEQYLNVINNGSCPLEALGQLDEWTAELFADAILKFIDHFNIDKSTVKAIGSHGQTIWHAPNAPKPFTMQLGNPHVIAHKTGISTVADFRRSDIARGGQGAPLAPLFHRAVFHNPIQPRCIVNIGGLSNVSIMNADQILGFDTGPGNCLMDLIAKQHFNIAYDKNGEIAKTGTVDKALLTTLLSDPYFTNQPPKSTGREYFNAKWLGTQQIEPGDLLATLLHLTAQCICDAIRNYADPNTEVYLCGGGAHNVYLSATMSQILEREVLTTSALGIEPDWVEAALFAWLAKARIEQTPLDASQVTGAKNIYIPGVIF